MKYAIYTIMILSLAGCASGQTIKPDYQQISSVECTRTQPIDKFDEKCDEPRLGWSGANFGSMSIQVGGASSSGL